LNIMTTYLFYRQQIKKGLPLHAVESANLLRF
jgi:hypothetical protein